MGTEHGVRIAIIGESVLVEGVVVNLEQNPTIAVAHFAAESSNVGERIFDFEPNVIVYELGFPQIERILARMRVTRGIRLVVLNESYDQVIVMDSRLFAAPSMADLQRLISLAAVSSASGSI